MQKCIILLFILIQSRHRLCGYNLKCPDISHWNLRGQLLCEDESKYICLFDNNAQSYMEGCTGSQIFPKGYRAVLRVQPDIEKCSPHRYQPFTFSTSGQSDCFYLKSKCQGEGQCLYDNGTITKDVSCTCNQNEGFRFIYKPKKTLFCQPQEDDCSCVQFGNNTTGKDLKNNESSSNCSHNNTKNYNGSFTSDFKDKLPVTRLCNQQVSVLILVTIIITGIFLCILSSEVKHLMKYFYHNEPQCTEEINLIPANEEAIEEVIDTLQLTEYYPSRIIQQDLLFLQQGDSRNRLSENYFPLLFLQRIITLNIFSVSNLIDECFLATKLSFHPTDLFYVLFLCCKQSLKRLISEKLALSNLAVPFLYRNSKGDLIASKWCLRGIQYKGKSVLQEKLKIVTFIRYGNTSMQTTRLLNEILSSKYHPIFCETEDRKRRKTDVIEASWYIPSFCGEDLFEDSYMFLYVGFDIKENKEVLNMINKMSHLIIFHVATDDKSKQNINLIHSGLKKQYNKIRFIEDSAQRNINTLTIEKKGSTAKMFLSDCKTEQERKQKLRMLISKNTRNVSKCALADVLINIGKTDEDEPEYAIAKQLAENAITFIYDKLVMRYDLPYELNIEIFALCRRLYQELPYDEKTQIQLHMILSPFVFFHSVNQKAYDDFFNYIFIFLESFDKESNICFWGVLHIIYSQIHPGNLCLHNFVSELCQVYELKMILQNTDKRHLHRSFSTLLFSKDKKHLPILLSTLLLSGLSVEYFDRRANMMYMHLLTDVLNELIKEVGDCKVLTVSMTGINTAQIYELLDVLFGLNVKGENSYCHKEPQARLLKVSGGRQNMYSFILLLYGENSTNHAYINKDTDESFLLFQIGYKNIVILHIGAPDLATLQVILEKICSVLMQLRKCNEDMVIPNYLIIVQQRHTFEQTRGMQLNDYGIKENLLMIMQEICKKGKDRWIHKWFEQYIRSHIITYFFPALWKEEPHLSFVLNQEFNILVSELRESILYSFPSALQLKLTLSEWSIKFNVLWRGIVCGDLSSISER